MGPQRPLPSACRPLAASSSALFHQRFLCRWGREAEENGHRLAGGGTEYLQAGTGLHLHTHSTSQHCRCTSAVSTQTAAKETT